MAELRFEKPLFDALEAADFTVARRIVNELRENPASSIHQMDLRQLPFIARYAAEVRQPEVLEEVVSRATSVDIGSPPFSDKDLADAQLITFLCIAVASADDSRRRQEFLERTRAIDPGFTPLLVEEAILDRGLERNVVLHSLGMPMPKFWWRYLAAASALGLKLPQWISRKPPLPAPSKAIIIRGLCTEYTPAVVQLAKDGNPDAVVIVSTWDTTDEALVDRLRAVADHVVLATDPPEPGEQNLARQIVLANAGLDAAAAMNATFCLVVRNDLALFRPLLMQALTVLWRRFPVSSDDLGGRIIVPSHYTRRYRSLHPSDFLQFGLLQDVRRFWSAPARPHGLPHFYCEMYLAKHLRMGLGFEEQGSRWLEYEDAMLFLRDHFIVQDLAWFGGCWLRGNWPKTQGGEEPPHLKMLTGGDWTDLWLDSFPGTPRGDFVAWDSLRSAVVGPWL